MEKSAESFVHLTDYRIKLKEQKAAKEAHSMPMNLLLLSSLLTGMLLNIVLISLSRIGNEGPG
jgi:hypothetical protein